MLTMRKPDDVSPSDRKRIYLFIFLLPCCVLPSCARPEDRRYELTGRVVSVDQRGRTVTLAHEEIKGYMEGMTMPFRLKDEALLSEMQPGDKVSATLVIAGSRSWLEGVVLTQERVDESYKPAKKFEPEAGDEVPNFSLVNQDGRAIHFNQYRGRALLLTFIYTRCPLPDYCPLMTSHFAEIHKTLRDDPALYDKTHLLSISVDPDYDKPPVLREYALRHNEQKAYDHWEMASGSRDEVKKVAEYFGLVYQ